MLPQAKGIVKRQNKRLFINLTPLDFSFSNPIPFIPFPLTRGRGINYIREASPLFNSPLVYTPEKERGMRL